MMPEPQLHIGHNATSRQFVVTSETDTKLHLDDATGTKMILNKKEFPFLRKSLNAVVTIVVTSIELEKDEPSIILPEKKLILPN